MGDEPLPVFVFGCVSCGKTVAGTETKCPRCGASFEDVKFECPFCGELVSPGQTRCGACGTEFASFSSEVSDTSLVELDGSEFVAVDEPQEPVAAPQKESVEYECPNCGKPVGESDAECPHCGARFS